MILVANPSRAAITQMERIFAENALKRYILTGLWRDAAFLNEPGCEPEGSIIGFWCDALERFA